MIQDIEGHIFNNNFKIDKPSAEDYVFIFNKNKVLLRKDDELFITYQEVCRDFSGEKEFTYLFKIDEMKIFLCDMAEVDASCDSLGDRYEWKELNYFRTVRPIWKAFAGITASQLSRFYQSNKYCGRCGHTMNKGTSERSVVCPECGFTQYPKISPAIIVAVTNGDKVVLTKYAHAAFKKYALIAGFVEFGETLEATVKREVMEEVGLKVKNVKYWGNQPWAFSDTLLVGFTAELDGDGTITKDDNELSTAEWVNKKDIPEDEENSISLTYTMMEYLKNN